MFELFTQPPDNLAKVLTWLIVGLPVAVSMEFWAQFLHHRLWHGPLWYFHESHHRDRDGFFELNDIFAVFHASVAVGLILFGCVGPVGYLREAAYGAGFGMSFFGLSYMVVHDGLVHERLPVAFLERIPLVRRIAVAHRAHHRTGAHPYGMFLGPQEARRVSRRRRQERAAK